MNCLDVRTDLALLAGGDLNDTARREELRRHLSFCRECRREYKSIKGALKSLSAAGSPPTWVSTGSLWPQVEQKILPRPRAAGKTWRRLRQLRHWSPLAAMTAACLLMVVAVSHRGTQDDSSMSGRSILNSSSPVAVNPPPETTGEKKPEEDDVPPMPQPM